MKRSTPLFFALLLLLSCGEKSRKETTGQDTLINNTSVEIPIQEPILEAAKTVLKALQAKDLELFTTYFPANKPVLFSPYGYIDVEQIKKLSSRDLLQSVEKKWVLTWGSFDGSGDPIKLTVPDYFRKFVYNADYLNADQARVNEFIGKGNSTNNLRSVFPDQPFVEFYLKGTEEQQGLDWSSLRLVFEKENDKFVLVGVVHDQWTI